MKYIKALLANLVDFLKKKNPCVIYVHKLGWGICGLPRPY